MTQKTTNLIAVHGSFLVKEGVLSLIQTESSGGFCDCLLGCVKMKCAYVVCLNVMLLKIFFVHEGTSWSSFFWH